jgi:AcrR family transcriptional regulator
MARISKDPQERKDELIQTAERLFIENGYEQTAVGDIVKAVNVAQGTFYYHFKSKADLLDAVVEKTAGLLAEQIRPVAVNPGMDPRERINQVIKRLFGIVLFKKDFLDFMHKPGNALLHDMLMRSITAKLVPILAELVAEGVSHGSFQVTHPRETVELLIVACAHLLHGPGLDSETGRAERMQSALQDLLERTLGTSGVRISVAAAGGRS